MKFKISKSYIILISLLTAIAMILSVSGCGNEAQPDGQAPADGQTPPEKPDGQAPQNGQAPPDKPNQ